jgi:hypothetical protein
VWGCHCYRGSGYPKKKAAMKYISHKEIFGYFMIGLGIGFAGYVLPFSCFPLAPSLRLSLDLKCETPKSVGNNIVKEGVFR